MNCPLPLLQKQNLVILSWKCRSQNVFSTTDVLCTPPPFLDKICKNKWTTRFYALIYKLQVVVSRPLKHGAATTQNQTHNRRRMQRYHGLFLTSEYHYPLRGTMYPRPACRLLESRRCPRDQEPGTRLWPHRASRRPQARTGRARFLGSACRPYKLPNP